MIHHNNIRSVLQRGTAFAAALALVAAAVLPATSVFADALNPLTERSLTLSSSSPGWSSTDGSGNSTYAPPNSGANGFKTGNYFDFKVSSAETVKTMSFQYCTKSAGNCAVPGNDTVRGTDDIPNQETDLNIEYPSAAEITNQTGAGTITVTSGDDQVVGVGTSFNSFLKAGGLFTTVGGNTYTVESVEDDTNLTLTANAGTTESGVTYTRDDFKTVVDTSTGAVKVVPGYTNNNPKYQSLENGKGDPAEAAKFVGGNFIVMYDNAGTWTQSTGWTISTFNRVEALTDPGITDNFIVITKPAGLALTSGQQVKVLFFATNDNYITNPGADEFFVKINTYRYAFDNTTPTPPDIDLTGLAPAVGSEDNIIDGGVTVANVVNQSIQITTKVLETMEFSVGTVDPNTLNDTELAASEAVGRVPCGHILTRMTSADPANVLQLGNQDAESSLETAKAYATHSYWRLSSNSSGGATVYYSGHTLSNTSGDEIEPIGVTAAESARGSEQFGLALATTALSGTTAGTGAGTPNFNTGTYGVNYVQDRAVGKNWENAADNGKTGISSEAIEALGATYSGVATLWSATDADWDYTGLNKSYHTSRLDPLVPLANYGDGSGRINGDDSLDSLGRALLDSGYDNTDNASFAFDPMSDTVPRAVASESSQVVDCVTAKVRYIGNIAATTPAGIYTTKVNWIAAPQY